eukprot:6203829-Pleurochrysis_carterae.AAC.3
MPSCVTFHVVSIGNSSVRIETSRCNAGCSGGSGGAVGGDGAGTSKSVKVRLSLVPKLPPVAKGTSLKRRAYPPSPLAQHIPSPFVS